MFKHRTDKQMLELIVQQKNCRGIPCYQCPMKKKCLDLAQIEVHLKDHTLVELAANILMDLSMEDILKEKL